MFVRTYIRNIMSAGISQQQKELKRTGQRGPKDLFSQDLEKLDSMTTHNH